MRDLESLGNMICILYSMSLSLSFTQMYWLYQMIETKRGNTRPEASAKSALKSVCQDARSCAPANEMHSCLGRAKDHRCCFVGLDKLWLDNVEHCYADCKIFVWREIISISYNLYATSLAFLPHAAYIYVYIFYRWGHRLITPGLKLKTTRESAVSVVVLLL